MRRGSSAVGLGLIVLGLATATPAAPAKPDGGGFPGGPHLRVFVDVVNDDGGAAKAEDAVVRVRKGGVEIKASPSPGHAPGTWFKLDDGVHKVSVTAPPGYTATFSGDCAADGTLVVRNGADRCRIRLDDGKPVPPQPAPRQPVLRIRTSVVNDDGGSATPAAATIRVRSGGADVAGSPAPGSAQGAALTLRPGTYTVQPTAPAGYTATIAGACAADGRVTLATGQDRTCTVILDDRPASLRVVTAVVNDDGGTATPQTFASRVLAGGVDVAGSPAPGTADGAAFRLGAGAYAVAAGGAAGYAATVGGACAADGSVRLAPGEQKTCTVTYDDRPASLRVLARIIDDTGKVTVLEDFELRLLLAGLGIEAVPVDDGAGGRRYRLATGRYVLASGVLPGYAVDVGGDCSADGAIDLGLGDEGVCTITFTALAPAAPAPSPVVVLQPAPVPPPAVTAEPLPPPKPARTGNLRRVSGKVRFKLPGSTRFVALEAGAAVPMGTEVDTRRGRVTLEVAADRQGATSTATFFAGRFKVSQSKAARPITTLALTERLTCPARGKAGTAAAKKRRLWGDGKGRFRTKGKYSSATVRGTRWLVEDRCDSTLTRVREGSVIVRDRVERRSVVVRRGKSYVARARR